MNYRFIGHRFRTNITKINIQQKKFFSFFLLFVMISYPFQNAFAVDMNSDRVHPMIDIQKTEKQLKTHLQTLTITIGERSVQFPENLNKTAN